MGTWRRSKLADKVLTPRDSSEAEELAKFANKHHLRPGELIVVGRNSGFAVRPLEFIWWDAKGADGDQPLETDRIIALPEARP